MTIDRNVLIHPSDGTRLSADVVIVGTGAGGAALGGALRRRGLDVLMVEAGRAAEEVPRQHVSNVDPDVFRSEVSLAELGFHANSEQPIPGLVGARGFHGLGGLVTRWARVIRRSHLTAEWDGPFPADELTRYLERAEALLHRTTGEELAKAAGMRTSDLDWWLIERLIARFGDSDADRVKHLPVAARVGADHEVYFTGADVLLAAELDAGALRILPGFVVRQVVHAQDRAAGVVAFETKGSRSLRVDAGIVVLAAGAIGNPQLIAGSKMAASSALGGYLTDHLMMNRRITLDDDGPDRSLDEPATAVVLPVSEERPSQSALLSAPTHAYATASGEYSRDRTILQGIFVGTEPVATNRLGFDPDGLDGFGLPGVSAEIDLTAGDPPRVRAAMGVGYGMLTAVGDPWKGATGGFSPLGPSLHVMGKYRMGSNADTSVADADSRMWGWQNVNLAGNGLLGSRNSCNPTLTTVAIALKAGRRCDRRMSSPSSAPQP